MNSPPLRLIVALRPPLAGVIVPELVDHGHSVVATALSGQDIVDALEPGHVDALLTDCGPWFGSAVLAECDAAGIRVAVIADSDAARRRAREVGVVDVLRDDASWSEIERSLRGHILGVEPVEGAHACSIVAVCGPAGAPGRSTIAVHLAAELARSGRGVLLIDADPYGGTVAQRLGLIDEVPTFAAAARLTDSSGLSQGEFERLAQRYESRSAAFWVLTGLIRVDRWPELSSSRVNAALVACAQWVDAIVVDTGFSVETDEEIVSDLRGPRRNASTLAVVDLADEVILVGAPDPIGLARLLRAHQAIRALSPPGRLRVVVNAVRGSAVGIGAAAQIRGTLRRFAGITPAALIPDDRAGLDSAVLAGRLVHDVAPRSPVIPALRALARMILPVPARPAGQPRQRASRRKQSRGSRLAESGYPQIVG